MDICTKIIKNNNKIKIDIGREINNGTHGTKKKKERKKERKMKSSMDL